MSSQAGSAMPHIMIYNMMMMKILMMMMIIMMITDQILDKTKEKRVMRI